MMQLVQDEWQANTMNFTARVTAAVNAGAISESTKYTLFQETGLAGLRLFVFVRRDLLPLVGNAHQAVIAMGEAGVIANKGAVAISCQVMGTHVGFVNSHLAADNDDSALLERNRMYRVCFSCCCSQLTTVVTCAFESSWHDCKQRGIGHLVPSNEHTPRLRLSMPCSR
jgi:hypothetical protein